MRDELEKQARQLRRQVTENNGLLKTAVAVPAAVALFERLSMHPVDTLITVQQKENLSVLRAARHIHQNHGFFGFYKGLSYPLVMSTPPAAILIYGSYEAFKRTLSAKNLDKTSSFAASSLMTGFLVSAISTPLDAKRIRDTFDIKTSHLKGMPFYYRGFLSNTAKMLLHSMIVLGGTDLFKNWLDRYGKTSSDERVRKALDANNSYTTFAGGLLLGSAAQLATTPLDVIKTKIMSDYGANRMSFWEQARTAYRESNLFTASGSRVIRFGLHSAIMLGCMNVLNSYSKAASGERVDEGPKSASPGSGH